MFQIKFQQEAVKLVMRRVLWHAEVYRFSFKVNTKAAVGPAWVLFAVRGLVPIHA